MGESEKRHKIRSDLVNKIFDKTYKVFRDELNNKNIKPSISFEEEKMIIGRFDDIFMEQKMNLYCTYFFDENIKPIFEKQLELIKDMMGLPKKEDKPQDTSYVQ